MGALLTADRWGPRSEPPEEAMAVATQTREFEAETEQLLDLMIHSVQTDKDILLHKLISNASDALDKLHFRAPAGNHG